MQVNDENVQLDDQDGVEHVTIKKDLYMHLAKTQVIPGVDVAEVEADSQTEIKLDQGNSIYYLNGFLFGKYMLTVKRIMVSTTSLISDELVLRYRKGKKTKFSTLKSTVSITYTKELARNREKKTGRRSQRNWTTSGSTSTRRSSRKSNRDSRSLSTESS